ncbi:MAG: GNAT family N-acetyltransferase [Syntrophorhabdaceae bacterium]|nr:GNAT family N-acetyltransferase [Syntrophorhabdaceae bacterium]
MRDRKPHINICPAAARIVSVTSDIVQKARSDDRSYLLENESKAILEAYGIRTTGAEVAQTEEGAVQIARNLGYPVVLKVVSRTVVHKTDAGGVKLDVKDDDGVRRAYREITLSFAGQDLVGVAVQKMAAAGLEVIVGFTHDESFGPVLMFGLGGIFAEVLNDVTFRILPVTPDGIMEMIKEIKGYPLLAGYRGKEVDIEALKELLVKVSNLALSNPSIRELDINPAFLYPSGYMAVDARMFIDSSQNRVSLERKHDDLARLFYPGSIAVLGATDTQGKLGYNVIYNLLSHHFQGNIYPVNPRKDTIMGLKAYPTIHDVPGTVDAAIIIVPAETASRAIEECCEKGIPYIIVETAGFAETGEAGRKVQAHIKSVISAGDHRLLGPNCSGIINTHHNMVQSIGIIDELEKGNVGLIAQAGVYAAGILTGLRHVINFGIIATIGNKMDITETDILEFMGRDQNIKVIALYMEDVTSGRNFIDVARRVTASKPIIALKTGRTEEGKKAVSSHTASMAGNDAINSAAFRQSGVIRARDNEHLFGLIRAFSKQPLPKGPGVFVVTYTGSLGVAATDMIYNSGLKLAQLELPLKTRLSSYIDGYLNVRNPVDCSFSMGPDQVKNIIETGLTGADVNGILVILQGEILDSYVDTLANIDYKGKPVLCCVACKEFMMEGVIKMEKNGIPVFSTPEAAIDVLAEMYKYGERQHKNRLDELNKVLKDRSFSLDDSRIHLRLLTHNDIDQWTEFVKSCSERSLWMRFLSPFSPTPENARRFCDINPDEEIAVVAETVEQGHRKLVAIARLIKCGDTEQAEYAVIVTDKWQQKTLGRLLLEACLDLARHLNIRVVNAEILQENFPMNKVLNHCNFTLHAKERNMLLLSRDLGNG